MRKSIIELLLAAAAAACLGVGCVNSHHETASMPPPTTTTTTTTVIHGPSDAYPPLPPTGRSDRIIVYSEPPPAPPNEVLRSPRDQDNQSWIGGYWTFVDQHWVWVPGHVENKPTPSAVWMPGHWDRNPDGAGWIWSPGRWE